MKVFAFDRDNTVSVNKGPVPLGWVKELYHVRGHQVWAIGNQKLRKEAKIPGNPELGKKRTKRERLAELKRRFPDAEDYIVVDDADLSDVEGWKYYKPKEFVERFKKRS